MAPDPWAVTPKTASSSPKVTPDRVRTVAQMLADQPVKETETEPGVWAVLTGISKNARLRPQGMNILLSADEHCLGRAVEAERFPISAQHISREHCKIYKDTVSVLGEHCQHVPIFLKDTSLNGTFVNWTKLNKNSSPVKLNHGDIISLPLPPHDVDKSFVFVYRQVMPQRDRGVHASAVADQAGPEDQSRGQAVVYASSQTATAEKEGEDTLQMLPVHRTPPPSGSAAGSPSRSPLPRRSRRARKPNVLYSCPNWIA